MFLSLKERSTKLFIFFLQLKPTTTSSSSATTTTTGISKSILKETQQQLN